MNHHPNPAATVVLTIAGFDPSGGAGISADLKTFAANNCYGVAAITALTVQNTQGVSDVRPVEAALLKSSIEALMADGRVKAMKIGMLGNRANGEVVKDILEASNSIPSVLDPVVRSSSGKELLDAAGMEYLRTHLLSRVSVVTPNMMEAAALTGLKVENLETMKAAAQKLVEMGARAAIVTGGHLDKAVDVLCDASGCQTFAGDRIKVDATHGTGCTFSSAIAANLALGRQLADSVVLAKAYVTEAIRKAYPIGPGRVPLNHLYRMQQAPRPDLNPAVPETAETVH
ncbi:MAG TPA: bifunctional hydroxymethylpyrimidine kinase/phosphomethylpyrimidine kinase [Terriglobia bacterium]|nr:bifunctional hydroxymethylpyrimidine kinase/phosphomethylpyrimidine kinase [Terriglobia bacterium]